jgi:threonine dehydrogenase-like Zn-dependent dehydrogenase
VGAKATVEFLMDRVLDTVQLFGVQREDYTFAFRHYIGLRLSGYPPHERASAEYAVDLIARGNLRLDPLVTHTFALEQYAEALDLLEQKRAIKVALIPTLSAT